MVFELLKAKRGEEKAAFREGSTLKDEKPLAVEQEDPPSLCVV